MKIKSILLSLVFLTCFMFTAEASWKKVNNGFINTSLYSLTLNSDKSGVMFVGAKSAVLKAKAEENSWQEMLITGSDNKANQVYFDSKNESIYVVTDKKVFKSVDKGRNFNVIYQDITGESSLNYFIKNNGKSYIASTTGLFVSFDEEATFTKIDGFAQEAQVYKIVFSELDNTCFVLTSHGLYSSTAEAFNFKRVFSANLTITEDDAFDYRYADPEDFDGNILTSIHIDRFDNRRIYLGTSRGLFISKNNARTFNRLILPNFGRPFVTQIINDYKDASILYAISSIGVSRINLKDLKAETLYDGLTTDNLRFIRQDLSGNIWLATDKGLFVWDDKAAFSYVKTDEERSDYLELQHAALVYNEVHPKKIASWRRSVKYRALFPSVKLDYDKTVTTALGATYDRVQVGPRDWGVSLSWDVANLIWNNYEDDIDTRGRLNTQLRIDILDSINRLYFERKRLISELENKNLTIEQESDLKLRIEAITADLDGYTGGYLSRVLERRTDK